MPKADIDPIDLRKRSVTCCTSLLSATFCLSGFCGFPARWVTIQLLLASTIGASKWMDRF